MAFFPCSLHGGRFRGAATHLYPAIVDGGSSDREHQRLCPDCAAASLVWAAKHAQEVNEATDYDESLDHMGCIVDGATSGETLAFFLTAYPRGETERQFFGRVCREHVPALKQALGMGDYREPRPVRAP